MHLYGLILIWTELLSNVFLADLPTFEAETWNTNYTSGVDFLDHDFYNLKNSSQDLSNGGSNFILSQLEVGH